MDESMQDARRAADGRQRRAGEPGAAGRPGGGRQDARFDLRASDAERDAVVTELGEHFQEGRLDQAEFGERVTHALAARTVRDLDGLLADLPPAREAPSVPPRAWRPPHLAALVPVLFAAILIAGFAVGGWHHHRDGGSMLWPLWWLLPILVLRLGWWHRGWRRRQ